MGLAETIADTLNEVYSAQGCVTWVFMSGKMSGYVGPEKLQKMDFVSPCMFAHAIACTMRFAIWIVEHRRPSC